MFTQCSKCETVFRLSADSLRAAGGQVRCGRCGEVFNALARLAEDATAFTRGESSLELETRADEILQSFETDAPEAAVASAAPAGHAEPTEPTEPEEFAKPPEAPLPRDPPDGEIARLEVLSSVDDPMLSEASLEFTLPPDDLDRIFIETSPSLLHLLTPSHPAHPAHAPPPPASPVSPVSPMSPETAERSASDAAVAGAATAAMPPAAPAAGLAAPASRVPMSRLLGSEVSEEARREMADPFRGNRAPLIDPPRRRVPLAAWVGAAIALTVLLAVQVIRTNSDWLAAHGPWRGSGGAGMGNLSAYQLRQWGVTGDPAAKGTLRVRASIMNTAAQLEPYPLLRVSLADRFGTRVGQRDFEPTEYLGKLTAHMLGPGERADAVLDILDPGKDAEGFEIDVCVRGVDKRISCAGDAAAGAASQSK